MPKTIGGTNGMHRVPEKTPFTPRPKMARSAGAHPTAAGSVGPGKSANAAMKRK